MARSPGPARTVQQDFSGGMFRGVNPELIPRNGMFDITNGLLDEDATIYRRGGSKHIDLLAGDLGAGGTTGGIVPDGDNGGWAASASPNCTVAVTDGNPATYAFIDSASLIDFDMQNVAYASGEGLASLTASYAPNHDSGVVVAIEIVDGGVVKASSTSASVAYTWPVPLAATPANAVKVRLRVISGTVSGSIFARTDYVAATWVKGSTSLPALPAAVIDAEVTFLWHGWLTQGSRVVFATTADFWAVSDVNVAQNLGGAGLAKPGRPAVLDGVLYFPGGATYSGGNTLGAAAKTTPFYASVANRLLAAGGDRIDFSGIKTPGTFGSTDFHKLPGGVQVLGIEGLRDSAVVFTTGGIWVIGNMAYNLTDDSGNVQQRLDHYSTDLVLWGDAGIAGWAGALVVPARDGVWLLQLGIASEAITAFDRISGPIEALYRSYVAAGYQPGVATISNGHYILPILSGLTQVDLLVCRLDTPGRPWAHMAGYGAELSAVAVSRAQQQDRLLGAGHRRLMELSYFSPSAATATDADGSAHVFEVTTGDGATGSLNDNTVLKLEALYTLVPVDEDDDVSVEAFVGAGRDPSVEMTALTGDAGPNVDGLAPAVWPVRKKARNMRFRLRCTDAVARLSLTALERFTRSSGRL